MPNGGCLRLVTGMRGDETVIEVHDTGVGIPAERIKGLFQMFNTTKSNGLGLGLVYCKKAVEAHGGRIEVESTPGVGSVFRVCLPKECH